MISSVGCKDSCWNLRQAVMLRLSTFASLVRSGYIAQNYFLFFAEAGFKLNHGMEIICVGCYIVHDIQDVRNDPSGTEYHRNSCKFITADSPILIENLDYSSLTGRLQSFKGIKLPYPLNALGLATNYVYRTDPGLCLVCYFCKVKIRPTYNTNSLEQLVKDIQERRPIGCLCRQRTQSLSSVSVIHLESPANDEYLHQSPADTASSVEDVPTCPGSSGAPVVTFKPSSTSKMEMDVWTHIGTLSSNNLLGVSVLKELDIPTVRSFLAPPSYPTYYSFKKRLESLQNWSFTHIITPNVIAKAGFFYAGYADCVRCFQCGLGLRSWKVGDDIYTEHTRYRPTCPFLQSVASMENRVNGRHTQESDQNQEVHSTHNPARQSDTFIGLGRHQPAYPDFIQIENRIKSFSELDNNANNIPVTELAEQGAFYKANYQMCCFDCGLQFNLDDDPVTKHKERNSRCIFMQTVKSAHTVTSKNISHIK